MDCGSCSSHHKIDRAALAVTDADRRRVYRMKGGMAVNSNILMYVYYQRKVSEDLK